MPDNRMQVSILARGGLTLIGFVLVPFFCLSSVSCSADIPIADSSSELVDRSNLDTMLTLLHEEFRVFHRENSSNQMFVSTMPELPIVGDNVVIDTIAEQDGASLEEQLRMLGATHLSVYGRNVSCHFPIGQIDKLARLPDLKFARPSIATTRTTTK